MSNEFKLYLLTRLDSVQVVTFIIFSGAILCSIIYAIGKGTTYDPIESGSFEKKYLPGLKKIWIAGIISLAIAAIIPSKREAIFIVAGGKTLDFVQSDSSLNKIPAQATKVISDYLENEINKEKKNGDD